jgi:hypothetical protein
MLGENELVQLEAAMKKLLVFFTLTLAVLVLLAQLVPYGKDITNPPVIEDAPWNSPQARQVALRACYDCHSNETIWPWYSRIAPISWLVYRDVQEGRSELNFSEWGRGEQEVEDIGEVIAKEEMPPLQYLLAHPEARLSAEDKALLEGGLPGIEREMDDDD